MGMSDVTTQIHTSCAQKQVFCFFWFISSFSCKSRQRLDACSCDFRLPDSYCYHHVNQKRSWCDALTIFYLLVYASSSCKTRQHLDASYCNFPPDIFGATPDVRAFFNCSHSSCTWTTLAMQTLSCDVMWGVWTFLHIFSCQALLIARENQAISRVQQTIFVQRSS